jgi:hypothetical protein
MRLLHQTAQATPSFPIHFPLPGQSVKMAPPVHSAISGLKNYPPKKICYEEIYSWEAAAQLFSACIPGFE